MKRKYKLGDELRKIRGSQWKGRVVGFYSTKLTPIGYAIESKYEKGSVQIYPETALEYDKDIIALSDVELATICKFCRDRQIEDIESVIDIVEIIVKKKNG